MKMKSAIRSKINFKDEFDFGVRALVKKKEMRKVPKEREIKNKY